MAELSLILVFVVQSFHSVVSSPALFLLWALLSVCELAQLWRVVVIVSPLILYRVIVVTTLMIVGSIFLGTLRSLEVFEVQMFDLYWFPSPMMCHCNEQEDILLL